MSIRNTICNICLLMGRRIKQIAAKPTLTNYLLSLTDERPCLFSAAVAFLALILRAMALLSLKDSIYFDFLLWDERVYHTWAMKIADGTYQSTSIYEFAPLPAYLMAFIYTLFSPDILYIRVLNIILGTLTCYLAYLIGKEVANRAIGLVACLIAALYKPFIFYSIVPLKTSLSLFLFALAIYFITAILNKPSPLKVLLLGIIAGLMLNVRMNYGIIIPLMLFILLLRLSKENAKLKALLVISVLFIAGTAMSMSPFLARNYKVAGKFALTTTQSGFNLYLGNNLENPDPYYRPVPFASSSPFKQGVQFTIEASRRMHKKVSPQEASLYWSREVLTAAVEQPAEFIWKLFQKVLVFFNQFEAGDHYHIGFVSDYVGFLKFPFFSLWLILPFGMAGMLVSIVRCKKLLALGAVFFLYALTLIAFFTNTRYRLPVAVILIPSAVIGIHVLGSFLKNKEFRNIALYASIVLGFFIVEFLPIRGTDDMTAKIDREKALQEKKQLRYISSFYDVF
ncbi:MAG: hypothetical protein DRG87_12410 [Deltaproteobacteria bacterium]|nr:MAG: hypothetical protein DRG87_12410 [Deltaproteobacteria bacterium]